ncbi:hypothetical protein LYNGBM3L_62330 [Moorena producens 3L]|uniref:Uncharacterized protein n=1 Tax=Moorena producens 3L TaxID=489825 RepID=F4Y119_9CYAN|nr:hypothetical protein LYNGBM3L_62330 [Moorena producens 3L]
MPIGLGQGFGNGQWLISSGKEKLTPKLITPLVLHIGSKKQSQ